jgi:signal recognition particle subunit SEC65
MHIGIITCEILRREIKEAVEKTGVDNIFFVLPETVNPAIDVLNRRVNDRFSRVLTEDGRKPEIKEKTIEKIEKEIREGGIRNSVIIEVMELRMHDCPDKLLAEIVEGIKKMSAFVDCVLLGYGLCGSTASKIERVIRKAKVPVAIPRGRKEEILNNCIEIALGRERVQELLREEPGTFFMTSINIMAGRMDRSAAVDTRRIIKLMKNHYQRVVKICYSVADGKDKEYSKTVENFAKAFGLEIQIEHGSSKIMLEALEKTKFIVSSK